MRWVRVVLMSKIPGPCAFSSIITSFAHLDVGSYKFRNLGNDSMVSSVQQLIRNEYFLSKFSQDTY